MSVLAASSTASQVYPGLFGFLVVAGMGVALFFLFRSMNKQLHKVAPGQPSSAPAGRRRPRAGLAAYRAMQAERAQAAAQPPGESSASAPDQSDS